jgi:hypothetical protein
MTDSAPPHHFPEDSQLRRILRAAGHTDPWSMLADQLAPTDLQSLLLAVFRKRAAAVSPSRLLAQYESNRFSAPSTLHPLDLARLSLRIHELAQKHGFTGLELSPLCPLGTNSAVATVDQNKVISTIRNTEVVSDPTNVLALECARRRRLLLAAAGASGARAQRNSRSRERVKLTAVHRVVRAQAYQGQGMVAHFSLLGLCTAGRDEGSFQFETSTLADHINLHLRVLRDTRRLTSVRVTVTDLTDGQHRNKLEKDVLSRLASQHPQTTFAFDDDRSSGRTYYTSACFEIRATADDGQDLNISDGGFTRWTAELLGNAKERLLTSGMGLERLCERFTPHSGI